MELPENPHKDADPLTDRYTLKLVFRQGQQSMIDAGWKSPEEVKALIQEEHEQHIISDYGEWVSVEDRLPENNEKVLFTRVGEEAVFYGTYSYGHFRLHSPYFHYYSNITHWMPLPEPKKGD